MKTVEEKRAQQRECMRKWRARHADIARERNRADYRSHRHEYLAREIKKRACSKKAVPDWLTKEHWREIAEMYERAQEMTERTGVRHDVDHIEPLKGKNGCGLHVPWNLQVVTHQFNVLKHYRGLG